MSNPDSQAQTGPDTTFLDQRLAQLGLSTEMNHMRIRDDSPRGYHNHPFFTADQVGNIVIHYFALHGGIEVFEQGRWRTEKPYQVKRLKTPQGKMKYQVPRGTPTRIYHTPSVIEKFQAGQPIETLFVVEGQFKALKGYLHGLDIVGISGIWNFRKGKQPKLKEDLTALIGTCKPKRMVLLFDADCMQVEYAEEKNLTERLHSFYGAVKSFREIMTGFEVDTYFSYIEERHVQDGKGLDDLLAKFAGNEALVVEELLKLEAAERYFITRNISDLALMKLKSLFGLSNVEEFYGRYAEKIGLNPFIWNRGKYQFEEESGKVELIRHPDSFRFIRVGCDYFKKIQTVNSKGEILEVLKSWQIGAITQDYVKELRLSSFLAWVDKFDDFTNKPDHSEAFRETIVTPNGSKNYNLYYPMKYKAEKGTFPAIESFFKHIFGEEQLESGHPRYQLGFDYLSILYRYPTQKLPIICLVSEERGTGKSTFMFLLQEIFGANATICGNDDMADSFNSSYITKLLAMIDEGVIEKRVVLEKIKSLSTAPRGKLHGKGRDKVDVDIFVKFLFTSNDEDNFINIHPKETRFWVLKVPRFKGEEHPYLLDLMKEEIPAFLNFLQEREICHPNESRMWFDPKYLVTDALRRVMRSSRSWLEKELREVIREQMLEYMTDRLCLTYNMIESAVCRQRKYQRFEILRLLRQTLKLKAQNSSFIRYSMVGSGENKAIHQTRDKGRFYTFHATDFLTEEEQNLIAQP